MNNLHLVQFVMGAVAFILAATLVAAMRKIALLIGMIDLPGARSSHVLPTPRGAGLAILISAALVYVSIALAGLTSGDHSLPAAVPILAIVSVALVGALDDRYGLPITGRLLVHIVASLVFAIAATAHMGGSFVSRFLVVTWWVFCGVSAINVTNFMDGTDGLIGSTVMIYNAYVFVAAPSGSALAWWALILSASCGGFLVWNWPQAKVFMGDVGSGALGLLTLVEGIALMRQSNLSIVVAFLPLLPIYSDAVFTIVWRIRRGENISTAHRSHLYQRLANGGWGHQRVAWLYSGAAVAGAFAGYRGRQSLLAILLYTFLVFTLGALLGRVVPLGHNTDCNPT